MAEIALSQITKTFPDGTLAVDNVDLHVADGEFVVLVGPSGCGKTTLLRMIAGLEEATAGRIEIGSRDVTYLVPQKRDVAMVFQNYALYPHLTVGKNLGYGLRVRGVPRKEADRKVKDVAEMLGIADLLEKRSEEHTSELQSH